MNYVCQLISQSSYPHLPLFSLELGWQKREMDSGLGTSPRAELDRAWEKGLCQLLLSLCKLQGQQVLKVVI